MNKKGFTLIELLAVVVILGVIMTIAIPNVLSTLDRNKKNTFIENAKTMVTQAGYTLRKDDNVEFPGEKGTAVLLTLEYLNTDDVSTSPYNTKYSPSKSFVVIVNSSTNDGKIGDVNGDGITDEKDVDMIRQALTGGQVSFTEEQRVIADANGDGELDTKDIYYIRRYISSGDIIKYDYYVHLVACTDLDCANMEDNSVNRNRGINLMPSKDLSGSNKYSYVKEGPDVTVSLGLINSDGALVSEDEIKAITGATDIKVFNKLD